MIIIYYQKMFSKIYPITAETKSQIHKFWATRVQNPKIEGQLKIYKSIFQQNQQEWYWNNYYNKNMNKNCFFSPWFQNQCIYLIKQLRKQMHNVPSSNLLDTMQQFNPQNVLEPFKDYPLWNSVYHSLRSKYSSHQSNKFNLLHRGFYLYKKFDYVSMQGKETKILESILNSVVALRMLESMKNFRQSDARKRNPKIRDCKFTYFKEIQFILDFDQFKGDERSWSRQMGDFLMLMLQQMQIKFNVSFRFYSQYDPPQKQILEQESQLHYSEEYQDYSQSNVSHSEEEELEQQEEQEELEEKEQQEKEKDGQDRQEEQDDSEQSSMSQESSATVMSQNMQSEEDSVLSFDQMFQDSDEMDSSMDEQY